MKSTWPPESFTSAHADKLPLPPAPGILRPTLCPRCGVIHASMTERRACQQQAWKEQA